MNEEHVCDASVPQCECGRKWEYVARWSDGTETYTSAKVVARYDALYGSASHFEQVHG